VGLVFRRRHRADRSPGAGVALLAVLACAVAGCGATSKASGGPPGRTYSLMQMNLCLSGYGDCRGKPAYPGAVDEAVERIREARPDAVTLNETCRGDDAEIARRTGYRMRFSRIIYGGRLLPCIRPGGRGLFGDAVLTKAAVEHTDNHDFAGQAGPERRRWICVSTRAGVDVCTAHLDTRSGVEAPANPVQCAELRALLARRARAGPVIFGGDVNRRGSCAPAGAWTRTDRSAHQTPGLQHVYGSAALTAPVEAIIPAENTDHDVLLVRARLSAPR
jgi:endonuclease/exonuclease/phosphatase family metal-dependent hydrolase